MKLLKRNKTSIVIPKGWGQITVAQHEEILSHIKEGDENEVRVKAKIIATATNKQPDEILAQPLYIINKQYEQLLFLTETHGEKFVNEIDLNGTTYVVNPDISQITADQFIFMNTILNETDMRQRARLTALFVWPKGQSFKAESFNEIAELLYSVCPCSVMIPLSNFFFLLSKGFDSVIRKHLVSRSKEQIAEIKKLIAMNE